jgi:phage-related holin
MLFLSSLSNQKKTSMMTDIKKYLTQALKIPFVLIDIIYQYCDYTQITKSIVTEYLKDIFSDNLYQSLNIDRIVCDSKLHIETFVQYAVSNNFSIAQEFEKESLITKTTIIFHILDESVPDNEIGFYMLIPYLSQMVELLHNLSSENILMPYIRTIDDKYFEKLINFSVNNLPLEYH